MSLAPPIGAYGKGVIRSYTPTSDDMKPGHLDLVIESYPNGALSKHISTLNVGQTTKCRGPKGPFRYSANIVRRIGMIAGGTGITPMLQIARAIFRGRSTGDKTIVNLMGSSRACSMGEFASSRFLTQLKVTLWL